MKTASNLLETIAVYWQGEACEWVSYYGREVTATTHMPALIREVRRAFRSEFPDVKINRVENLTRETAKKIAKLERDCAEAIRRAKRWEVGNYPAQVASTTKHFAKYGTANE